MKDADALKPKLAVWKVSDLKIPDFNPRKITKARLEDLKRSLAADPDFLEVRPVIVNVNPTRRGIVIGGSMRLVAARELGRKTVPVVEVYADARKEKAWVVKDNAHSGEYDRGRLGELVLADPLAFEHALPSDQLDDIFDLMVPAEGEGESEEAQADAIAAAKKHILQDGDVVEMGDHRLVCGDSTDPAVFDALLGKERAQMCFTDPPFNVGYEGGTGKDIKKRAKIANDKMTPAAWVAFLRAFMKNIHERTAGAAYVCMSAKEWPAIHAAFIDSGFHWSNTILWIKDSFTMGRADHQRSYEPIMVGEPRRIRKGEAEPILYGWPQGVDRRWNGGRDTGDAWFFTRPHINPVHPTQKPVELVAKAIANSSNRGDIVLDPFAGGGSTMIAAERTGRRSRLVELDAGYCDAIVARYVGHTKNAKLTRNGKPFAWTGPVITIEGVLDSLG